MLVAILCALLLLGLPLPAIAVPALPTVIVQMTSSDPVDILQKLFQQAPQASWFAPQFLRQIPLRQLRPLLSSLKQEMGELQGITPVADGYELTFEQGVVPAKLQLNGRGQIALLFFGPPENPVSLAAAVQAVQAFPGEASLLVLSENEVLADVQADKPLAVGSAFKLAVLVALKQAIAAANLGWSDVVTLQPEWRSLPSGLLQDWPAETAITLESLATLMVSISDNTAADALIHTVGRPAIEALAPHSQPFFTTREFFALKNPANVDALAALRAASLQAKRSILDSLQTAALPEVTLFAGDPIALDIEWFFSARELCGLIEQVRSLPLMTINPGVAKSRDWQSIAFKGGSEPGVLNLTTALEAADGRTYCIAATWNSPNRPLDENQLTRLYGGVLSGLSRLRSKEN